MELEMILDTVRTLEAVIARRDAEIFRLVRRVESLEAEVELLRQTQLSLAGAGWAEEGA